MYIRTFLSFWRDLKDPTSRQNFDDTVEQKSVIDLRACHMLGLPSIFLFNFFYMYFATWSSSVLTAVLNASFPFQHLACLHDQREKGGWDYCGEIENYWHPNAISIPTILPPWSILSPGYQCLRPPPSSPPSPPPWLGHRLLYQHLLWPPFTLLPSLWHHWKQDNKQTNCK